MSADLSAALTDSAIRHATGGGAFARGVDYARQGRVSDIDIRADAVDSEATVLRAAVGGSGGRSYTTQVTLYVDDVRSGHLRPRISHSWCDCPVSFGCKHAAALMLVARERFVSDPVRLVPTWERQLANLLQDLPSSTGRSTPVAVQFEVTHPRRHQYGGAATYSTAPRLTIRPVVWGRSGKWVRSSISWDDVRRDAGYGGYDPAHLEVLKEFDRLTPGGYLYRREAAIDLSAVRQGLWGVLDQARDAGLPMVLTGRTSQPVIVRREAATVQLDVRREAPESDLYVRSEIRIGQESLALDTVGFLGNPAHGCFTLPKAADDPTMLVRFDRALSAPLQRFLEHAGELRIPAADAARFVEGYYPRLRQTTTIGSEDASVPLPVVSGPRLVLTAAYSDAATVTLTWGFRYDIDGRMQRHALRAPRDDVSVRDYGLETRLLDQVDLPNEPVVLAVPVAGVLRPIPEQRLDGLQTVAFTEQTLPALRAKSELDVEVLGDIPDFRLAVTAPRVAVSATDGASADWFDLGVTVTVDGHDVGFADLFAALAAEQPHLLLDNGTYFPLDDPVFEALSRLIAEARALNDRPGAGLTINPFQAGLWEELVELGVVEEQSRRWAATVEGLLDLQALPTPELPSGISAELRPYQLHGYHWLRFLWEHNLGGILADDMGLGKTLQTLALICHARAEVAPDTTARVMPATVAGAGQRRTPRSADAAGRGMPSGSVKVGGRGTDSGSEDVLERRTASSKANESGAPFLVVAPTSVIGNWAIEAVRFAPGLRVVAIESSERKRGASLAEVTAGADLVVTSYTLFRIDEAHYQALPWAALVLDEAQFVKNHRAKTYQCARKLSAPFKLAITGTPLENSLMDLWALLSIVAPGLFPQPKTFADLYAKPIERGDRELLGTLRRRVRPLLLRRTKEEVATELPPKQETVLSVELSPRHRKMYETHLQRERQKILGLIGDMQKNRFTILSSLTLLRQLSLDPALVDDRYDGIGSAKIDVLLEHLEEVVSEGHRALIFSQFTGFLRRVRDRLDAGGIQYAYLDGRTRKRAAAIDAFKSGDAPVFVISLKAGGFGLNLTEADYCFVLDPWWNPAVEAQAVDRTHRIGQRRTVMVYRLVSNDTIETKVMELKARKQQLFASVMDGDGQFGSVLTADDIRGLLGV